MFDQIEMMRMARAMGLHVQQRHIEVARNIANADTPGFRATDLQDFSETYRRDRGEAPLKVSHPRHLDRPDWSSEGARVIQVAGPVSPNGNSVSLEEEMVRAAEVKRHHDLSLAVYRSGLDLMRASLGRR
ncbi:FlgB family protein [Paracoccus gahaiensis]|uniref:FlgB family protein n=1 Tax=Paracoccus gahaiensis TaxID=1706839 RepID=A0A4U0RBG2_9RHOB|nr:FlgB family protein [Paracoccus gahaiensis]TJZ92613.1 FlgB family protein [Paracoccus gahaiensis]